MHTGSTRGLRETGALGGLLVILSCALFCCSGCVEEQPTNLSDCINNSLSTPISRTDAVIVALAHPGIAEEIENTSFNISVGTLSVPEVREGTRREFYVVRISRFNITTDEPLESIWIDVTHDGRVYKVRRMPSPSEDSPNPYSGDVPTGFSPYMFPDRSEKTER